MATRGRWTVVEGGRWTNAQGVTSAGGVTEEGSSYSQPNGLAGTDGTTWATGMSSNSMDVSERERRAPSGAGRFVPGKGRPAKANSCTLNRALASASSLRVLESFSLSSISSMRSSWAWTRMSRRDWKVGAGAGKMAGAGRVGSGSGGAEGLDQRTRAPILPLMAAVSGVNSGMGHVNVNVAVVQGVTKAKRPAVGEAVRA